MRGEVFLGQPDRCFYRWLKYRGVLGMSKLYYYELIAKLNDELEKLDKIVIPSKYVDLHKII